VVRHRGAVLALSLLLTLLAGLRAATGLRFDASLEAFLGHEAPVRLRLEQFRAAFGRDEVFVVVATGEVFTAAFLDRLAALRDDAAAIEEPPDVIAGVDSVLDARVVRAGPGLVRVDPLADLLPDVAAFRAAALDSTAVGNFVAADGRAAALVVRTPVVPEKVSHALYRRLVELTEAHAAPGFALQVAGAPALAAAINARTLGDAYRSLGAALLLIGALLALMFRHPLAVIGPFAVVFAALAGTFGLMAATDYPMTALHNILPTLLLTVGLGDAVHLQTAFRVTAREGAGPAEAAARAVALTGRPIVFTSLTTALGMLGFTVTRLGVTSEFGVFAALGVLLAMVLSLTTLPALLAGRAGAHIARGADTIGPIDRWVDAAVGFALRRWRGVLLGAAVLIGVIVLLLSRLTVAHDPLRFLPDGHPVRAAFEAADAQLGGTVNLEVVFDAGADDGLADPDLLRGWAQLEAHLLAWRADDGRGVGGHASLLDAVRETWGALGGEGDLPPTRPAAAQTLLAFEMAAPDQLGRVRTGDGRLGRLSLRLPWLEAHQYGPLAAWLEDGAARFVGDAAEVWPTGGVYTLLSVVDALIGDMARSFALALSLVFVALVLLLRSLRLGLLAMVPNVLPIGAVLALMAVVGVPLDLFNLLLASIAIGVVVDDTIHFFHHVAARQRAGAAIEDAVRGAARHAGRAMVATSVMLCAGFGAFLTAGMANLQLFGGLLVATIVLALVAELLLGPALLQALTPLSKPPRPPIISSTKRRSG
jgi:predicted RND superfamily exporter protein